MDSRNYKGHNEQSNNKGQTNPSANGMSYITKKSEKLTTALYMVTDIMSDKEPLKWKMREIGVEILSDVTFSGTAALSERMSVLRVVMKKIERMMSMLEIAQSARMLSEMNAAVLKKEYAGLKDAVESEWSNIHSRSKNIFSDSFFKIAEEVEYALPEGEQHLAQREANAQTQGHNKGHMSDTNSAPQNRNFSHNEDKPVEAKNTEQKEVPSATVSKPAMPIRASESTPVVTRPHAPLPTLVKPMSSPSQQVSLNTSTPRTERSMVAQTPARDTFVREHRAAQEDVSIGRTHSGGGHGDRRSVILALVKDKPSLTIKDITKNIPNVSEKTIQRELLAMVAEGTLVKRGERRWSTYSLR